MLKEKHSIIMLCRILKCSKSGYYDWIKLGRPEHKSFSEELNNIIIEMHHKNKTWGIREIKLQIKKAYSLALTNKTVYRYMKLNELHSVTRRKIHSYPKTEHHKIPNLLHRNFNTNKPNEKWSIDISYLFLKDGIKYLCAIKDMCDKSIVSNKISSFINLNLVLDTVREAIKVTPKRKRKGLIMHSDQGWHFTNSKYQELLKKNNILQSMSSKGSCVDNVPIESFFSILKSECIYLRNDLTKNNIDSIVENFINYYNKERLQEKLKGLSPNEYRRQALK